MTTLKFKDFFIPGEGLGSIMPEINEFIAEQSKDKIQLLSVETQKNVSAYVETKVRLWYTVQDASAADPKSPLEQFFAMDSEFMQNLVKQAQALPALEEEHTAEVKGKL